VLIEWKNITIHSKRIIDIFFYKYICGTKSPVKWHKVSWHKIVVARSHPNSFLTGCCIGNGYNIFFNSQLTDCSSWLPSKVITYPLGDCLYRLRESSSVNKTLHKKLYDFSYPYLNKLFSNCVHILRSTLLIAIQMSIHNKITK